MKVKHLCPHCDAVLECEGPDVREDMAADALEGLGRAVIESRVVHALLDCEALLSSEVDQ